jgi:unsaturated rhamnogalacturonyl hydrolase
MDWTVNMLEQNLCDDGMISYSQGKNSDVRYVDTLGMVCAFLALYGKVYNQKKYIDLSFNQIESFRKSGLYENTQLPCHAFNSKLQLPLGVFGWGRGTVWYTLALVDTYEQITDKKQKDEMKSWIELSAEEYKGYQKDNGGFYTIMQDNGQYDSSATAGMAYFYRKCATIFNNNEYDKIADKCIERLMQVTMKNGAIDQCQGDTHGIGVFSQVFDIMPFAQGLTLRAIKNKG